MNYLKNYFLIIYFCLVSYGGFAQDRHSEAFSILQKRGEIHFSFSEPDRSKWTDLTKIISIDKVDPSGILYAYANQAEFEAFLQKEYTYQILNKNTQHSKSGIEMATTINEMDNWDRYPTYEVYLALMERFQTQYPSLCKIDTMGYSVNGKILLAAHITNRERDTPKPGFFYSSTMHGDEVTGFILMLRLIDYLLKGYTVDDQITCLLDRLNIYINPNTNPDGTYYLSDQTIQYAKRYNANDQDLNRNFPNYFFSSTKASLQPENQHIINYIQDKHIVMSASLHGGAEIFNIPWDVFTSDERRPQDSVWWKRNGRSFIDTCRKYGNSDYMTDIDLSGLTYGGDWYIVYGGRQDYLLGTYQIRDLTLELSSIKMPPASQLPLYWETCYRSLLYYIKEANLGIQGSVVNSNSKQAVKARIVVENHDDKESSVYSSSSDGYFFRPIQPGNYSITVYADGYASKTVTGISLTENEKVWVSIELELLSQNITSLPNLPYSLYPNPAKDQVLINCLGDIQSISLHDLCGKRICSVEHIQKKEYQLQLPDLIPQIYVIHIKTSTQDYYQKLIIK